MNAEIMNILEVAAPLMVRLLIAVLSALLARYVLPWLKDLRIWFFVQKFVSAAEKLASTGALEKEKKNAYVCSLLEKKGIKVTPIIKAMIEAAVDELDLAKNEILLGLPAMGDKGEDEDVEAES